MSRSGAITKLQKEELIAFMERNEALQQGKFSSTFTFKNAQKLWEEITEKLNSVAGGTRKDWKSWRKTWQDLKKNVKSRATTYKMHAAGKGGGEPKNYELNEQEEQILNMLPAAQIEGISGVFETPATFNFGTSEEVVAQADIENMEPNPINLDTEAENETDHSYGAPPGKRKITKSRRLEESIQISKQFVSEIEEKNNIVKEYYATKKAFFMQQEKYNKEKLEILRDRNTKLNKINENLHIIAKSLSAVSE